MWLFRGWGGRVPLRGVYKKAALGSKAGIDQVTDADDLAFCSINGEDASAGRST